MRIKRADLVADLEELNKVAARQSELCKKLSAQLAVACQTYDILSDFAHKMEDLLEANDLAENVEGEAAERVRLLADIPF